jgi:cytochrome c-type biogenesis protein CcmE
MNVKILIAVGLLVAAVAIGLTSFKQTMTTYTDFAGARKRPNEDVQVSGLLASRDYVMKQQEQYLKFSLRDTTGDVMNVEYHGVIPGNFAQAMGLVAVGRFQGDHFEAKQLLVKCPSKYQALAKQQGAAAAPAPAGKPS